MAVRFRLRDVSKAYRNRRSGPRVTALEHVDLDIAEGAVSALTGRSGAGKSTLARIVIGFETPDSGAVLYRGSPLAATPRCEFCRCNQMVFQNPLLAVNPLFTVEQIVGEPLRTLKAAPPGPDAVPGEGIARSPAWGEKIRGVMAQLELPAACLGRRPQELSGGELQRVVLARALILKPEFLVLDEPFSALDDLTAMRLLRQLKGLIRRLRLGALFVSHHPHHVAMLADHAAVLERGRLVRAAS